MGSSATERNVEQDFLVEFLGEGLTLFIAALALAFEPVAEHFVEENGGGAAGEYGRSIDRLRGRRLAQRLQARAKLAHGRFHHCLRGQALHSFGFESLRPEEVHAVVGAGDGKDHQARLQMWRYYARTLRRDVVVGLVLRGEHHQILVDVRVFAKDLREGAHTLFPGRAIDHHRGRGLADRNLGRLVAEVGRRIFLFGAHLRFGLHPQVVIERAAIARVCTEPESTAQGHRIVRHWKGETAHS